jgi:hypothetical protein
MRKPCVKINTFMKRFKEYLLEAEENKLKELKTTLQDTPAISMGKKLISSGLGAISSAAGKAFGPITNIASGDVVGTALSLGSRTSPIGMAHSVLTMGKEANATPYPLESDVEEVVRKDELLSNAMNPLENPVTGKAPVELKRSEWRRKERERKESLKDVGTDFRITRESNRGSAGPGGMTPIQGT